MVYDNSDATLSFAFLMLLNATAYLHLGRKSWTTNHGIMGLQANAMCVCIEIVIRSKYISNI